MLRPSFLLIDDEKGTRLSARGFWLWTIAGGLFFAAALAWKSTLETDWDVLVTLVLTFLALGFWTLLAITRLHDMGLSGWWAAGVLLVLGIALGTGRRPFVFAAALAALLALGFSSSQPCANRYGPLARANGRMFR